MTDIKDQYVETTDLYREMLWQAQRVEDLKLVSLLHQRLLNLTATKQHNPVVCRIIPFPALRTSVTVSAAALQFWPVRPAASALAHVGSYCLLLFTGVLANLL